MGLRQQASGLQNAVALYQLGYHPDLSFKTLHELLPYWLCLGISHLHISNIFSANASGLLDPHRIGPLQGGEAVFRNLLREAFRAGLGTIVEMPSVQIAKSSRNPWLRDVLEKGPSSPYVNWFQEGEKTGKKLFPISLFCLDKPLEEMFRTQELTMSFNSSEGIFWRLGEEHFPLCLQVYGEVACLCAEKCLEKGDLARWSERLLAYSQQIRMIKRPTHETINAMKWELSRWFSELLSRKRMLREVLADLSIEQKKSFLADQYYRLLPRLNDKENFTFQQGSAEVVSWWLKKVKVLALKEPSVQGWWAKCPFSAQLGRSYGLNRIYVEEEERSKKQGWLSQLQSFFLSPFGFRKLEKTFFMKKDFFEQHFAKEQVNTLHRLARGENEIATLHSLYDESSGCELEEWSRLCALSHWPQKWNVLRKKWNGLYTHYIGRWISEEEAAYVYQMLLALWPLQGRPTRDCIETYAERIVGFPQWRTYSKHAQQAIKDFASILLEPRASREFLADIESLAIQTNYGGAVISLQAIILQCLLPGIPEIRLGDELWRHVHSSPLRWCSEVKEQLKLSESSLPWKKLLSQWKSSSIKQHFIQKLLLCKKQYLEEAQNDYQPLQIRGSQKSRVFAFLRGINGRRLLVILPRFSADTPLKRGFALDETQFKETYVCLPSQFPRTWKCNWDQSSLEIKANKNCLPVAQLMHNCLGNVWVE